MHSARPSLAPVLVLMLTLTACAGPLSPETPSSPGATPSGSASAEPVVATPGPRVPGGCDYLFPTGAATAYLGEDAQPRPDEADGSHPGAAAAAIAGIADCTWTGSAGDVSVVALADGAAAYFDSLDEAVARGQVISSVLTATVGERDSAGCYGEASWSHCEASFAVNGYWVTIYHNVDTGIPAVYEPLTALAQGVHERLDAIDDVPARFVPPVSRDGSEPCPTGLDPDGAVFAAAGVTSGYGPKYEGSGDGLAVWYEAEEHAGLLSCTWTGSSDLFYNFWISAAPGSGWAWPDVLVAYPDAAPVTVAGASDAIGYCDQYQCWVQALVGESWMEGSLGAHPDRGLEEVATSFAAAIPLVLATFTSAGT